MIIDCHTHLSKSGHEGMTFAQIGDLLLWTAKKLGIRCSFVYPDSEPGTDVADLKTTRSLVRGHAELLLLGTASIPVLESTAIRELEVLADAGEIIGIKLYPGFELFYPDEDRCDAIYELCVKHDVPVVFH